MSCSDCAQMNKDLGRSLDLNEELQTILKKFKKDMDFEIDQLERFARTEHGAGQLAAWKQARSSLEVIGIETRKERLHVRSEI